MRQLDVPQGARLPAPVSLQTPPRSDVFTMMGNKKSFYYNEIGIKISSLRLSVRFPCAPMPKVVDDDYEATCQNLDHYRSDWTWVPVKATSTASAMTRRPLPPPPVPPRAASPCAPAIPPYPSSTVSRNSSRKSSSSSVASSRQCWSYV